MLHATCLPERSKGSSTADIPRIVRCGTTHGAARSVCGLASGISEHHAYFLGHAPRATGIRRVESAAGANGTGKEMLPGGE